MRKGTSRERRRREERGGGGKKAKPFYSRRVDQKAVEKAVEKARRYEV